MSERNCKECTHYNACREWYGHEKGMPNYAVDIECGYYEQITSDAVSSAAGEYAWHDLKGNPSDLPKEDGEYWVHGIWGSGKRAEGGCFFRVDVGYFDAAWNFNIIAWRKVEPFQEKE